MIMNLLKTVSVNEKNPLYSLVTYGKDAQLLVSFADSVKDMFKLEDVQLSVIGGPRNVDKALNVVNNDVFNSRSPEFYEKVKNGIVFVFTTGKVNEVRNDKLNTIFERLSNRNVDMIFVDTNSGDLNVPFRDILTNVSTDNIKLLPSVLTELSSLLARHKGKCIFITI